MRRRTIATIARLVLSVVVLGLLFLIVGEPKQILSAVVGADIGMLLVGFVVISLDRILMSYKWGILLGQESNRGGVLVNCQIYCTAMIFGLFLPMTIGADTVRTILMKRRGVDVHAVIASIVMERTLGFIASLCVGLVAAMVLLDAGLIGAKYNVALYGGIALLITAIVILAFSLSSHQSRLFRLVVNDRRRDTKIGRILTKLNSAYFEYSSKKIELTVFFLLTVIEQLATVVFAWVVGLAFHLNADFLLMLGVVPLATLVSRLPISFDGIGVVETGLVGLLALGGVPATQALAFSLMARFVQIGAWLPWWLTYFLRSGSVAIEADAGGASKLLQ